MSINLDEETKSELRDRITRIENGERPQEMKGIDWLMPIGACAFITLLLIMNL